MEFLKFIQIDITTHPFILTEEYKKRAWFTKKTQNYRYFSINASHSNFCVCTVQTLDELINEFKLGYSVALQNEQK